MQRYAYTNDTSRALNLVAENRLERDVLSLLDDRPAAALQANVSILEVCATFTYVFKSQSCPEDAHRSFATTLEAHCPAAMKCYEIQH
jgi:hypothetical protein